MQNFLIGGLSGMIATTMIQPIDFLKVQIQNRSEMGLKRENLKPMKIAKEIYKSTNSFSIFYRGLDSALLRQLFYTSTRLGLFYSIHDYLTKLKKSEPTLVQNSLASLLSGAVGSFIGNPADLALIRMQSDNNLPLKERRNYKNVFDAIIRIIREEGVFTLWRGSMPTVLRAMVMNFSLMVPFEFAKIRMQKFFGREGEKAAIFASLIAGACASFLALPFDNIKTKLQKMKKDEKGKLPYKGVVDCFKTTVKKEGFSKLWVGLNTFYVRVAPHAVISLVVNDSLRHLVH